MISPMERVVERLAKGPGAPDETVIRHWIDQSMRLAKKWEDHGKAWESCSEISQKLKRSASDLLNAIEAIDGLVEKYGVSISLPVEVDDSLPNLKKCLSQIATYPNYSLTDWDKNRVGKGRGRLPVAVVMLHVFAAQMLNECGIPPSGGLNGLIAQIGKHLCHIYGINLPRRSSKAAKLAKSAVSSPNGVGAEFYSYQVLPDLPLEPPLFLFE